MRPLHQKPSVLLTAFRGEAGILKQSLLGLVESAPGVPVCVVGSDDAELAAVAANAGAQWLSLLPDACPQDTYWCLLVAVLHAGQNREEHEEPRIVLRAGTELPPFWYGRLCPLHAPSNLAAWFPLCVRHPCTGIFQDSSQAPAMSVAALDTWLNRHAPGCVFDLPLLSGWTAWLDPRQLPQQEFRSDAALAAALIESGKLLLASDALVVDDSRFPPQIMPELYPAWRDSVAHHHPLAIMRHAMSERAARRELPPPGLEPIRPVRLHLSHGWGGGLWRWVEDFTAADRLCHNLILRPVGEPNGFGKTLVLYRADADTPLASWTFARPILSTALAHQEYTAMLRDIIARHAVSEVLISSLIGHSLDALGTGLPTTIVCHDFYPLCPLVMATWDSPCRHCDDSHLRDCLQHNPAKRFFSVEPDSYWQTLRTAFVALAVQHKLRFVAPTPAVATRWQSLAVDLPATQFDVIGHGLSTAMLESLAKGREQDASTPLNALPRIVILGSLEVHKGGALLRDALPALLPHAEILLLGVGESGSTFENINGILVIRDFQREQLGSLLAEHRPVLGLLLSTVPETFSYTLSELQAAGIPVAATALGAFADRIQHEENGWLFEPRSEALGVLVQALVQAPERIAAVRQRLLGQHPRSAADMVADYNALSGEALALAPLRRPGRDGPGVHTPDADGAVYARPEASFREALQRFARYSEGRIHATGKLPGILKRALLALVRLFT